MLLNEPRPSEWPQNQRMMPLHCVRVVRPVLPMGSLYVNHGATTLQADGWLGGGGGYGGCAGGGGEGGGGPRPQVSMSGVGVYDVELEWWVRAPLSQRSQ